MTFINSILEISAYILIKMLFSASYPFSSVQFSSVAQLCPTLCDPMDCSTSGLPVYHQLPEFTQAHVLWVDDAIQPSHPLLSPSPPAFILSQHQGLFQWVSFFASGGQSTGVSASTSVLPKNTQDWSPSLVQFSSVQLSLTIYFTIVISLYLAPSSPSLDEKTEAQVKRSEVASLIEDWN